MQTDYIDLYQLHGGTLEDPIDEIIEAFEILQSQGKIRYYGLSSIRPSVIREYVKRSSIVSVMMQYSLLDRRPEETMLPFLQENNIGVLARGAVAKGHLISKPAQHYLDYSAEEVAGVLQSLKMLSDDSRLSPPGVVAIQFVLYHTGISSAVIGIRTMEQLRNALLTVQLPKLNELQINKLINLIPVNTYQDHR